MYLRKRERIGEKGGFAQWIPVLPQIWNQRLYAISSQIKKCTRTCHEAAVLVFDKTAAPW